MSEQSLVSPADVGRSWVPLFDRAVDALERARWGCEEAGISVGDDLAGLMLLPVTFTATGFGHYYLDQQLTGGNQGHWRFHGPIHFNDMDAEGNLLISVGDAVSMAP